MYCSLACIHASTVLKNYLNDEYYPMAFSSILSYSPPAVVYYKLFSDDVHLPAKTCFCLLIFWGVFTTGLGVIMFFFFQVVLVLRGQTPHEFKDKNRDYDYGKWKNIEAVFGKLWFVYFIMPFPQKFTSEKAVWGGDNHVQNV